MRQKFIPQINLFNPVGRNSIVKELEQISQVLDANPKLMDLVFYNLTMSSRSDTGRKGMTAEQVLRCAVLKQYRELTYEELAFHLEDSDAFRTFSRLEMGQYPCKSILQENVKSLSEETWEAIHSGIIDYAQEEKIDRAELDRIGPAGIIEKYPTQWLRFRARLEGLIAKAYYDKAEDLTAEVGRQIWFTPLTGPGMFDDPRPTQATAR